MLNRKCISGPETWRWIEKSISDGPSLTLSKCVISNIDSRDFECFVEVEGILCNNDLMDFKAGGKVSGVEAYESLIRYLSLLASKFDFSIVAEDWCAKPESVFLHRVGMPAFFYKDEVYYIVESSKIANESNLSRIMSNTTPTFNAFLVKRGAADLIGEDVDFSVIESLANSVCAIISGVYDGEGYILCTNKRLLG